MNFYTHIIRFAARQFLDVDDCVAEVLLLQGAALAAMMGQALKDDVHSAAAWLLHCKKATLAAGQ